VTGEDREQALQRSRRALAEMVVEGMATVLPFHRAVLDEPAFTAADGSFGVHTRWIETEFDNTLAPFDLTGVAAAGEPGARQEIVAEVNGRRITVSLPAELAVRSTGAPAPARRSSAKRGGSA